MKNENVKTESKTCVRCFKKLKLNRFGLNRKKDRSHICITCSSYLKKNPLNISGPKYMIRWRLIPRASDYLDSEIDRLNELLKTLIAFEIECYGQTYQPDRCILIKNSYCPTEISEEVFMTEADTEDEV